MNDKQETTITYVRKRVYDPLLIFLHWWNALLIISLFITVWAKPFIKQFENGKTILWMFHSFLGFGLSIGIALRVIWGFFGPHHARFKNMIFISQWLSILKTGKFQKYQNWGHDIYASFAYLVIYVLLLFQVFTGFVLDSQKFSFGPFGNYFAQNGAFGKPGLVHTLKEIHEVTYFIILGFFVVHIFMIIFHEIKDGFPIAQSMLSGFQYRKK